MKKLILSFATLSIISFFAISHVSAQEMTNEDSATATPTLRPIRQVGQVIKPVMGLKKEIGKDLKPINGERTATDGSKPKDPKMCQAHVNNIKNKQLKIAEQGLVMQTRWNAISNGVQKYYTEKLVPNGKTLSNYDALVSDVNAKKEALTPLIDKVKSDSSNLTCDKDQAKTQFDTFKTDWQALLAGIKAYKFSVVALVKGVVSVAGKDSNLVSPSASQGAEVNK